MIRLRSQEGWDNVRALFTSSAASVARMAMMMVRMMCLSMFLSPDHLNLHRYISHLHQPRKPTIIIINALEASTIICTVQAIIMCSSFPIFRIPLSNESFALIRLSTAPNPFRTELPSYGWSESSSSFDYAPVLPQPDPPTLFPICAAIVGSGHHGRGVRGQGWSYMHSCSSGR